MKLLHAPIIEAVLDIDCDMPPKFDLMALEELGRKAFRDAYPRFRKQYMEEHWIKSQGDAPSDYSTKRAIQAFHFLKEDERQIVQLRAQGFSFNRLAPYSSLDDYLPEIERAWKIFLQLSAPVQIRVVRLRYINRILLPADKNGVELSEYLKIYPILPNQNLVLAGFLNQYFAIEKGTEHQVNIVLTGQPPENEKVPIIFDNSAAWTGTEQVENWPWLLDKIMSLRALKNSIFETTLTETCLNLFQQR